MINAKNHKQYVKKKKKKTIIYIHIRHFEFIYHIVNFSFFSDLFSINIVYIQKIILFLKNKVLLMH